MFEYRKLLAVAGLVLLAPPGWGAEKQPGELRLVHQSPVFGVVFAPGGHTLYTASNDATVRAWDVGTGKVVRRFKGHTGGVLAVALTADGKTLATGGQDSTVRLWEARTGKMLHALEGIHGDIEGLALSADGSRLAASGSGLSGFSRTPRRKVFL
jgi:WD40 repeat protein